MLGFLLFGLKISPSAAIPYLIFLGLLAYFTIYLFKLGWVPLKYFGIVVWSAMMALLATMAAGPSAAGEVLRFLA